MKRSRGGISDCDAFKEELLAMMRSKFSTHAMHYPLPLPGEGEGEGKIQAAPPSPSSSPSKRRARTLSEGAARNVRVKKDFGIKVG
jgi:hypothetical protein